MCRALLFALFATTSGSAQVPRVLMEAAHCSLEKQMLSKETKFPLRIGYTLDKRSFQTPELFVVFLPLRNINPGLVIGLSPERSGQQRTYYVNNNAGFVAHSSAIDFTPDAPLGGLATQSAMRKDIRSAINGRLYTISQRQIEATSSNLRCIGFNDPPQK